MAKQREKPTEGGVEEELSGLDQANSQGAVWAVGF